MIKKLTTVAVLALFSVVITHAQGSLLGKGLSSDDIVSGLKDALNKGTQKSTDKLSAVDGFFKAGMSFATGKQIYELLAELGVVLHANSPGGRHFRMSYRD